MTLEELIHQAYKIFEKYTIGTTLDVCKRCCVSDSDEAALVNTPLREITAQQLRSGYFESARSYSERELWEMKHFLPRVLELMTHFEVPDAATETVFHRLELHKQDQWPAEEMQLLTYFSKLFFEKCLSYYPYSPDGEGISTYLVMFSSAHFDLKPILATWENTASFESVLHYKDLVMNDCEYGEQNGIILKNAFNKPETNIDIEKWLNDKPSKARFSEKINQILTQTNSLDSETVSDLTFLKDMLVL
ncbi:MAG: hypothetical protein LCH67_07865 [Bacteroidetes bacterium]|nr:hypothetical protein [Bacteroidota bacterium]